MKKTFLLIAIIFSLIFMPRVNADADEAKVNVGGGLIRLLMQLSK